MTGSPLDIDTLVLHAVRPALLVKVDGPWQGGPSSVRHSGGVITVLMRFDHHIDHTFVDATHYRDDDSVLTIHVAEEEVARFPAGSWDGVYCHGRTRVREKDGRERTAQRLEVEQTVVD